MSRLYPLIVLSSLVLIGCPADGPIEPLEDAGNNETDTGSSPDAGMEATIELDAIEPTSGPIEGGTEVTLTGSGFIEGMTVRFGSGASVDATVTSETQATATTPASPTAGTVTVVVRHPDGETDSLLNGFEYTGEGMPDLAIGFCQLQAQSPVSVTTGEASDALYAVVFVDGVTQGVGQGSGVEGELGWGTGADFTSFNYVPTTYNLDVDGLNAGDLANDEYGATLTIPTAGTYRYAARFRIAGSDDWTYCDLDGSDGSDGAVTEDQLGTIEVTDPAVPTVGFCRTDTTSLRVETGSATDAIRGTVFVAGATVGDGAGDQVVGEIMWGEAGTDPTSWTDTATATYESDADGLTVGDKANDVWAGTITPSTEGDYEFLYRFSADGGTTWQLCDTDGASGPDDFDDTLLGTLEVRDTLVNLPDACNLQFPQILETGEVGTAVQIYGRVTEANVTGSGTPDGDLVAELLVGPTGEDPSVDDSNFDVITASVNTNTINLGADEDEYVASFTPTAAGEYAFAYRFSVDGGTNWSYCGLVDEPAQTGTFGPTKMGWLGVTDGTPQTIDFCHVWQDTLTDDVAPANLPTVTVEVFEDPLTVGNGGSNSGNLDVEAAAIGVEENPALASTTWTALPYKDLRPSYPNNYEYEGTPYEAANQPGAGTYNVFVRVRESGAALWTYCDVDENATEVRLETATSLTVSP